MTARRVLILGSTGSIGVQTIDVITHLNALADADPARPRFEIVGLTAGTKRDALADQCRALGVTKSALAADDPEAPTNLVHELDADIVVAAIVGFAGLAPTLAAAELGRTVLLANKESLVAGGPLVMAAARRSGARIHPIDSEHAAAWVCLRALGGPDFAPPDAPPEGLRRLVLTASGGPFRERSLDDVAAATREQALDHPNWSMGAKVTIDSATLTNKALELIEAHWLFGLGSDRLDAIIHPQSAVHALVETTDGGSIAHIAPPDMRIPIQLGLTAPATADRPQQAFGLASARRLDFEPIDPARWPVMTAARDIIDRGGSSGAIFNAANEAAVEAFLAGHIPFGRITDLSLDALGAIKHAPIESLADAIEADRAGRAHVAALLP